MAGTFRGCPARMVMAAALLGTVPPAVAEPVEPQTILLVVVNQAEVPQEVLKRGEREATRVYRSLGINLLWTDTLESTTNPRIIVNIVSKPTGGIPSVPDFLAVKSADWRVLGVAPGNKERRDLVAWAFYERILDFTTILGLDPGVLLGHVIAHEIGHLLLPYDSHSQVGLMRSGWDKLQAANAAMGTLTFTPGESGLIRRSLARMVASR